MKSGKVRSWSDMNGKLHGRYQGDERQLGWPGLVCIDWSGKNSANWKADRHIVSALQKNTG